MAYNIDSIDIIANHGFAITVEAYDKLAEELGEDVPEISIFDESWRKTCCQSAGNGALIVSRLWWQSIGSGASYDTLVKTVLPRFTGSADIVVTWEGGDSLSGLRVRDGVVTTHRVIRSLGEEVDE